MNTISQFASAGAVAAALGCFAAVGPAHAGPLGLSGSPALVAPAAKVEQAHYRRHYRAHHGYHRPYYGYRRAYPHYARPYYYPSYGYYPAYGYPAYYGAPAYGWSGVGFGWGW